MAKEKFHNPVVLALRDLALTYPEVNEGDACVKRSFKVRSKSFLFLGENDAGYNIMFKLDTSIPEARKLAKSEAGDWGVGDGPGWVTLKLDDDYRAPVGLVERWIDESFRLQAPKKLLAELPRS